MASALAMVWLNGLIAFSREDIEALKPSGQPIILVRPDTVPDDMELLFDCQGLLTAGVELPPTRLLLPPA
jgi:hypothetical protein